MADIILKKVRGSFVVAAQTEEAIYWLMDRANLTKIDELTYAVDFDAIPDLLEAMRDEGLEIEEEEDE